MAYRFQTPTRSRLPRTPARRGRDDRFWRHIRRGYVGSSVLKAVDGSYVTVDYPSQDQVAASAATYLGGHIYFVSVAERGALTAAGYTVEVVPSNTWSEVAQTYARWNEITETGWGTV